MFTYIEQSEGEGDMILRQDRKVANLRTWNTLAIFPIALILFLMISFRAAISLGSSTVQERRKHQCNSVRTHNILSHPTTTQSCATHLTHGTHLTSPSPHPTFMHSCHSHSHYQTHPHLQVLKAHHHHPRHEYSTHSPTSLSLHGWDTEMH